MMRFILSLAAAFASTSAVLAAQASAATPEQSLVVLDPGHIPSFPGAAGACGGKEVQYNDAMAGRIEAALSATPGISVRLTRKPGKSVLPKDDALPPQPSGRESVASLAARAATANDSNASLFVSIHHDSTEDRNLFFDPAACDGRGGTRLKPEMATRPVGYNIFVFQGDASNKVRFDESVALAEQIGRRLRAAGLVASDIHQKPTSDCNSCRPVDKANGVWNQDLFVLKKVRMPAVLVECELITDPDHQARADDPAFQATVARAVSEGVAAYENERAQMSRRLPAGTAAIADRVESTPLSLDGNR